MQHQDDFLDCLQHMQKATPKPYLATRVKAKYANQAHSNYTWQKAMPWAIATVFLFNALLLWQSSNNAATTIETDDTYAGVEVTNNYNYFNQIIDDEK